MKRAGKWLAALAVMGAALLSGCGAAGETAPSPPAAEEVAALVRFLASKGSGYITGQVSCIDGGMSL